MQFKHFTSYSTFVANLNNNNIVSSDICFIQDTQQLYTHGTFYYCSDNTINLDDYVQKSGATMTGKLVAKADNTYNIPMVRNIILSTSEPDSSQGSNGDIWIVVSESSSPTSEPSGSPES